MRVFIIALGVLCLAFPGMASTTTSFSPAIECSFSPEETSPELLESIFRYLQQHHDYNFEHLCTQYKCGEIGIEQTTQGYLVSVSSSEGLDLILILEDL